MAAITINNELNGIEIRFDSKPDETVIAGLKENGFRWSGKQKMWYARQNDERLAFAQGIGDFSLPMKDKYEKSAYCLWDMTRTDDIESNFAKYHIYDTKEIAAIIRKHLRERFKMCKWSITSDTNSISISLLASPFAIDSDELKAIVHYAYEFAESYNYDNSDSMTDYFDVNFYGVYENSIVSSYHYTQTEMTVSKMNMCAEFQQKKAEFEAAEEIRKQKEFEERCKQQEIERAEAKKAEEIRKANVQTIEANHEVKEVNYTITNALLKANKDDNLDDTEYYDGNPSRTSCQVSREVHFTADVYALFERCLLSDFSFLSGMGGSKTDDLRIQSMTDYNMMSGEDRESVEWYNCNCVAIFCDGELKLIIDPQGYEYARYVYVADEQSERVDNYRSDSGIEEAEHNANSELADVLEGASADIIIKNNLMKSWNGISFDTYKDLMKKWISENGFKLTSGVVRAIKIEELKVAMYKILQEVQSIAEQFCKANLYCGQKLTVVKINDFGMLSIGRITFDSFVIGDYAQYKNSVRMTFKPSNKRGYCDTWYYGDVIFFDGWYEVPDSVLYETCVSSSGRAVMQMSKYSSCDKRQYDAILECFKANGIKPIINTYKPEW